MQNGKQHGHTQAHQLFMSTDYARFDYHPTNRGKRYKEELRASMIKNGFIKGCAIHCVPGRGGRLQVLQGHHRFATAKELGIPFWYIVSDTTASIYELESVPGIQWRAADYVTGYAKDNREAYLRLLNYSASHGIAITVAASLMGGGAAGTFNNADALRAGEFEIRDPVHAERVASIVDYCRKAGVRFATSTPFVRAVDAALRVDQVDVTRLIKKLEKYGGDMARHATRDGYLDELENVYNYQARGERVPVKMLARQYMQSRQRTRTLEEVAP